MKTTQPPVTSDHELAGSRAAAEKFERLMQRHEDDWIAARQVAIVNARRVNQIGHTLGRLYAYHQGITATLSGSP